MNARMLNDIQCRQMKSKSAYTPHEPPHQEISGMASPILEQTRRGQPNVGQQFIGILIRIGAALVARLEPFADLPEEHAVWHPIVPRRRQCFRSRQHCHVGVDALGKSSAHADAIRALAQ